MIESKWEKEPARWCGDMRFIQDIWKDGIMEKIWGFKSVPGNTHIFLCGNPGMTSAMLEILNEKGFVEHSRKTPGQIHIESW